MKHVVPPDVQVVQDAVAFATAAVDGDVEVALAIGNEAVDLDRDGFLDALASTVATLADVTDEAGGDPTAALREVGVGIELAVLAELAARSRAPDHSPSPTDPDPTVEGDHDGQEEQDRP
jgi:hypothetical protein